MRLAVHAPGDALDRAEQVDQHRHGMFRPVGGQHMLEQHGGTALGQEAGLNFGHFEDG